MTEATSWCTVVLLGLEDAIRRADLVRGIVLCTAAALLASSCSAAEPTTTSAAPTTTGAITTTTEAEPPSTVAATTTTAVPPSPDHSPPVTDQAAPAIDGVIADGEWDGATETTMTDGSTLRWLSVDNTLYVSRQGEALGAVNLALGTSDEVWILHSSAALGSVRYAASGETWTLVHDFDWCCRGASNEAAREDLLGEEGWQANIGFAGDPGTVEYELTLQWADTAAAVMYRTEDSDPAFWPTDLSPEAAAQLIGPFPDEAVFHIAAWTPLDAMLP